MDPGKKQKEGRKRKKKKEGGKHRKLDQTEPDPHHVGRELYGKRSLNQSGRGEKKR